MKLTKLKLQQIIKEEAKAIIESSDDWATALQRRARAPRGHTGGVQTEREELPPVEPQELGPEDEPEEEDVDLGEQGPTSKEQLFDAAEMLIDKIGRDLDEKDIGILYDVAMYINNHGPPNEETLGKIIRMERPFSDMPTHIHSPTRP